MIITPSTLSNHPIFNTYHTQSMGMIGHINKLFDNWAINESNVINRKGVNKLLDQMSSLRILFGTRGGISINSTDLYKSSLNIMKFTSIITHLPMTIQQFCLQEFFRLIFLRNLYLSS